MSPFLTTVVRHAQGSPLRPSTAVGPLELASFTRVVAVRHTQPQLHPTTVHYMHTQPCTATQSHTEPHRATYSHIEPHPAMPPVAYIGSQTIRAEIQTITKQDCGPPATQVDLLVTMTPVTIDAHSYGSAETRGQRQKARELTTSPSQEHPTHSLP